jgi:hypothetical protein
MGNGGIATTEALTLQKCPETALYPSDVFLEIDGGTL